MYVYNDVLCSHFFVEGGRLFRLCMTYVNSVFRKHRKYPE